MPRTLTLSTIIGLLCLTLCGAHEPDSKQAKESYLKKANADVQAWNDKLKSLEERSEKSGSQTRQKVDREIRILNENLAAASKRIDNLRTSNEGTWNSFRADLEKALRDVKSAFEKAQSFFDKNETKKEGAHEKKN